MEFNVPSKKGHFDQPYHVRTQVSARGFGYWVLRTNPIIVAKSNGNGAGAIVSAVAVGLFGLLPSLCLVSAPPLMHVVISE